MRLSELAFACYIYGRMTDYDSSYCRFLEATSGAPDLTVHAHRIELLKWLNKWGCRQFREDYYELASEGIRAWHEGSHALLPRPETTLLDLSDADIQFASIAYGRLLDTRASRRSGRSAGEFAVRVGPTGAAKVLFAIRPKALIPWDAGIRDRLGLDGSAACYVVYARRAKAELEELDKSCQMSGCNLSEVPALIGRPCSTIAKLVDEYFWVTITRKCPAPGDPVLARWATWR